MEGATPESLGFCSGRLARIGVAMQRHFDEGRLPCVATLIARRGRVVHLETVGWADLGSRRPLEPDTICRIYSMTKPITVVAALLLWEEGRFLLDDPIGDYLPELASMPVLLGVERGVPVLGPASRPVTIRHLMTHTAGMTYGVFEGNAPGERMYADADLLRSGWTMAQMVAALGKLPLLFDPGSRWLYSVSIDVVGRLVEVVSGQSLGEFFQQRIFEPLGMVDTGFALPEAAVGRLAALYEPAEGGGLTTIPAPCGRDFTRLEPMCSGGGGLVGTIVDYARFAQMLLSGGELHGTRVLAPGTVALMASNHLAPEVGPYGNPPHAGHDFGLGVRVLRDPGLAGQPDGVGSFGWSGLAHTDFWVDPANEVVGVFMTQLIAPQPGVSVPQQFRNLVYQALVG